MYWNVYRNAHRNKPVAHWSTALTLLLYAAVVCALIAGSTISADTTLRVWQFWTDPGIKPTIDSIVTEFESTHPGVSVELTDLTWANGHEKIAIAFASGTAPDVIELGSDWVAQFADAGHLLDISAQVADKKSDFDGWGMATYEESIWGMPWILGTRVVFVNLDLLGRAGYEPDHVPVNLADFKSAVIAVDQLGKDIYGWGSNTAEKHRLYKKFLPFLWSFGGHITDDQCRYSVIASQNAVNAVEFYRTLHRQCGYVANQRGIEDAFLDGKIGFILSGEWLMKRIALEKRPINYATTIMPGPNNPNGFLAGDRSWAANSCVSTRRPNIPISPCSSSSTSPRRPISYASARPIARPIRPAGNSAG